MPLSPRRVLRTFRYAMLFDGVDDWVVASLPNVQSYTVHVWVNPLQFMPFYGLDNDILGTHSPGYYGSAISLIVRPYNLRAIYQDSARIVVVSIPGFNRFYFASLSASNGGDATLRVYDGGLIDSRTVSGVLWTQTISQISLGGAVRGIRRYSNIYLSNVMIYSRILSETEISWNYVNPDNPIRNGLVLWLRAHPDYVKDIDGDGLLEWLDLSGYGNHGKIYGARLVELIRTPTRTLTVARTVPVAR
jgi:hypothetical protein